MGYDTAFSIGNRIISNSSPTYFIADIGANHDGSLERAKDLIKRAAASGAHCAKFQHFKAKTIVSDVGFRNLKVAHQAKWPKSVYATYEDYSLNHDWNHVLAETATNAGIDFMTTPYDMDAVVKVDPLVKAYKVGSGDITYLQLIRFISSRYKPIFLATGASTMAEVIAAVKIALMSGRSLCLMQCNTNYTGDFRNSHYANLKVLSTYSRLWPGMPLGLSDHTLGHVTALGAVALGARVIEKHFTDDPSRNGPDHKFALSPMNWGDLVWHVRELEQALGDGVKTVEANERESVVVQRRAIRVMTDMGKGSLLSESDIEALRPCPPGAMTPADANSVVARVLNKDKKAGEEIYPEDLI